MEFFIFFMPHTFSFIHSTIHSFIHSFIHSTSPAGCRFLYCDPLQDGHWFQDGVTFEDGEGGGGGGGGGGVGRKGSQEVLV